MRNYDQEEAEKLNADQWQLDLLKLNPGYTCWGPHEDYMSSDVSSWSSRIISSTWPSFGPWKLDDYNEVVNFYFSVSRASEECSCCGGNGYHADAQQVVNTFYAHMNPRGEHWNDKITQDELDALVEAGRAKPGSLLDDVNAQNAPGARGFGHDAINRFILTRARLSRLGIPVECAECGGSGSVYTAPSAHVSLVLWVLHPRKGASRGVEIERIEQSDLPAIFAYLREAAERNAHRFSAILQINE